MNFKPELSLFRALIALMLLLNCGQGPNAPEETGALQIHFQIADYAVLNPELLRKHSQATAFSRIELAVYHAGTQSVSAISAEPIAWLELNLAPSDTAFKGILKVPAGADHLLIARLFEALPEENNPGAAELSTLSFCGRQQITVTPGTTVEAEVRLFPVPIRNERIVLHLGPAEINTESRRVDIPLAIANLDSLRGIQFDLLASPISLAAPTIVPLGRLLAFDRIESSLLASHSDFLQLRVLIFDQSTAALLQPIPDPCGKRQSDLMIQFQAEAMLENVSLIQAQITGALATSAAHTSIEVWVVNDEPTE